IRFGDLRLPGHQLDIGAVLFRRGRDAEHDIAGPVGGLADSDHVMLAGAEMVDRLAGVAPRVDPVVEMDVARALGLVEVPFAVPEIQPPGRPPDHAGAGTNVSPLRTATTSCMSIARR